MTLRARTKKAIDKRLDKLEASNDATQITQLETKFDNLEDRIEALEE